MKKILLLTTAILLTFNISSAKAESSFDNTYVGIDLQRTNYNYTTEDLGGGSYLDHNILLEDSLNGINIYAGKKFNKNFGVEAGFFYNREEDKHIANGSSVGSGTVATADINTKVKSYGLTVDAIGYMPINEKFELLGSAGVSYTKAELTIATSVAGSAKDDETEAGFRLGAGGLVHLTDKIDARVMTHYQTADFDNIADNAWVYSLGVNYNF